MTHPTGRVLSLAVLAAAAAALGGGASPALGQTETLQWLSWQPRVFDATAPSPLTLTVKTNGAPTAFVIQPQSGPAIPLQRVDSTTFRATVSAAQLTASYQSGDRHAFVGFLDPYSGATRLGRGNLFVNVRTAAMPSVAIRTLDASAQLSRHVLNLRDDDLNAGIQVRGTVKRLYGFLGDDFDFVAVVAAASFFQNRIYEGVKNDTRGIGRALSDSSSFFGSGGRLQGVIHFPNDNFFDLAESGSIHEIGHRWINYLTQPALRDGSGHWPLSDLAYGIMGYSGVGGQGQVFPYELQRQPNGDYLVQAAPRARDFNDLELYLMGLASESSVRDHVAFDRSQFDQVRNGGILRAPQAIRIGDIVAADGPRVPATGAAPKAFHLATVVLSSGRLLTPGEMAFFDAMAARGEATAELPFDAGFERSTTKPLFLATGQRATLSTTLVAPAAPKLTRAGKAGQLRARRKGRLALVSATVNVDGPATVTVAALTPAGKALQLAGGSRLGKTVAKRAATKIATAVKAATSVAASLLFRPGLLKPGIAYRLLVKATGEGGSSQLTILFLAPPAS